MCLKDNLESCVPCNSGNFLEQSAHGKDRDLLSEEVILTALEDYAQRTALSLQASGIQTSEQISLADFHISGKRDEASAADNTQDVVEGSDVHRSAYGNAPGGETMLSGKVMEVVAQLGEEYLFRISELAGGSHSRSSRQYTGQALDVDLLNGAAVSERNPAVESFVKRCRDLGANLVLGPGDPDHATQVRA